MPRTIPLRVSSSTSSTSASSLLSLNRSGDSSRTRLKVTLRFSCEARVNCIESKSAVGGRVTVLGGNCGLVQVIGLTSSGLAVAGLSKSTVMDLRKCEKRCLDRFVDDFFALGPSSSIASPLPFCSVPSSSLSSGAVGSVSSSKRRPSMRTLYRPEPGLLPGAAPLAVCQGWFSTVLEIQMRIVRYFLTVLLIESWMSRRLRTMAASRRFSRSRRLLYCCTPSPMTTSSMPSGMFLSVGLRLRRRAASLGGCMLR